MSRWVRVQIWQWVEDQISHVRCRTARVKLWLQMGIVWDFWWSASPPVALWKVFRHRYVATHVWKLDMQFWSSQVSAKTTTTKCKNSDIDVIWKQESQYTCWQKWQVHYHKHRRRWPLQWIIQNWHVKYYVVLLHPIKVQPKNRMYTLPII